MKKRIQILLTDEAWKAVDDLTNTANTDFKNGRISYTDAINEMLICSKVDIQKLQTKHINLRKSLKIMATEKDLDVDALIKTLVEYKNMRGKRPKVSAQEREVLE